MEINLFFKNPLLFKNLNLEPGLVVFLFLMDQIAEKRFLSSVFRLQPLNLGKSFVQFGSFFSQMSMKKQAEQ
jgi:hypothetical protein